MKKEGVVALFEVYPDISVEFIFYLTDKRKGKAKLSL
jgi:hypothetical protein